MAVAFTRISWWLWGAATKDGEPSNSGGPPAPLSSSFDFGLGFREPVETLRLSNSKGSRVSSRKCGKRKWQSREQRRIDREYDLVVVPSDGGCLSGSESEDSDWSIGWLEPHAPDFQSDGEGEGSFAVLVPCYGRGLTEPAEERVTTNHALGPIDLADSSDSRKYMEELLSTLQSA